MGALAGFRYRDIVKRSSPGTLQNKAKARLQALGE